MYSILPELYRETATRLSDIIDGGNYYSGAFDFRFGDVDCRFVTSVIVYRKRVDMPEGACNAISDLVPVWWEFHTYGEEGEILNDFDFAELKNIVISD